MRAGVPAWAVGRKGEAPSSGLTDYGFGAKRPVAGRHRQKKGTEGLERGQVGRHATVRANGGGRRLEYV